MKAVDIKKYIQTAFSDNKRKKIIFIIGIVGILLIFISELMPNDSSDKVLEKSKKIDLNIENYINDTEKRLNNIISSIKGVGKTDVMISVEGTEEYLYAEDINNSVDKDEKKSSEKIENKIVISEQGGKKDALVKKIIFPQISGVIVVCEGGGNYEIKERVMKAVATALGLPSSKVCIENKK